VEWLRPAFRQFRNWLTAIYRSLKRLRCQENCSNPVPIDMGMKKRLSVEGGENAEKNCGLVGKGERGRFCCWNLSKPTSSWIDRNGCGAYHEPLNN
jgi:hypothetical protein